MQIEHEALIYALDNPGYHPYLNVTHSTRARRLSLRMDPKNGEIKLIVPKGARLHHAVTFIEKHERWIYERISELPAQVPLSDSAIIPIFGKDRRITVSPPQEGQHGRTTVIELGDEQLNVFTKRDDPSGNIRKWIKDEAKATLSNLSHEKAAEIGKKVVNVSVRDTSSRWGSCSHDGRLSYSWRLLFCPFDVIDYVAAHEVAHLKHMDHSRKFWDLCEQLSEDMNFGRQWLKQNGSDIMRYG